MDIEQVKAWYEGAEEVFNRGNYPMCNRALDFKSVRKGEFNSKNIWADAKPGLDIQLWNKDKGFTAEITKYRELKVGDTVELNGLKGEVMHGELSGLFFLNNFIGDNNRLIGSNTMLESNEISNRILGYSEGGSFPGCRTLQDLSKLYWVRKYELKYAGEDSANKEKHKTANNMSEKRELIGYNWKEEKYAKAWSNISNFDINEITRFTKKGVSIVGMILEEIKEKQPEILDLWTVPVYREKEKVFTMGFGEDTFEVKVEDGRAYHGTDDITEFVEGLNEIFNTPTTVGGYSYVLEDKNVVFTRTGCQDKKSSLEQWDAVHDALG